MDKNSPGLLKEITNILKTGNLLNLGCGNSNLHTILYENGVKNITNCDYSKVLIDKM